MSHVQPRSAARLCLAAALMGASCAVFAQAQSSVQLYGLVDAAAGRFQASGDQHSYRVDSGGLSSSFLGFKGTEDLGGGLKVKFVLEHYMRVDTGASGRYDGDSFFGRNAYVGLSGQFGTTVLGRSMTPLYNATTQFNAFGDSFLFSPSMRQLYAPNVVRGMGPFYGDTAWNNSVHYSSRDTGGFSFGLIGAAGEHVPGSRGRNLGANLGYTSGPFEASLVWQRVRSGLGLGNGTIDTAPAGFDHQTTFQLGASYDLAVAKLFGLYTQVRTDADSNDKTLLYQLGATVPLGGGKVLAQYGYAKTEVKLGDTSDRTFALGYDYSLSKRTDVYALFSNDKVTRYASGNSLAAGIRLLF